MSIFPIDVLSEPLLCFCAHVGMSFLRYIDSRWSTVTEVSVCYHIYCAYIGDVVSDSLNQSCYADKWLVVLKLSQAA